jgi:hypothetical protein
MIAKANAMNSTAFARGPTVAGNDGMTAAGRREIRARPVVRAAVVADGRRVSAASPATGWTGLSRRDGLTCCSDRAR